jgi:hypothetical protein
MAETIDPPLTADERALFVGSLKGRKHIHADLSRWYFADLSREAGAPKPSKKPKPLASGHADNFQTPASALDCLMPYLPPGLIWDGVREGKPGPWVIWSRAKR